MTPMLTLTGYRLSVVPLSVLSNWVKQIEEHCTRGALSSCVYYGASRSMSPEELREMDVVITTYQTVAGEQISLDTGSVKKKKTERSLFEVQWKASRSL
jgi:SWI/SNF-related matrix-associated actin-dependent regulator of chromatin subfamily A3